MGVFVDTHEFIFVCFHGCPVISRSVCLLHVSPHDCVSVYFPIHRIPAAG